MSERRPNPYKSFRFTVELGSVVAAGFSSVSGLEVEMETEEYDEGGVNAAPYTYTTGYRYPNLTLERGMTESVELVDWLIECREGKVDRRNVRVLMLDSTGQETWGWEAQQALPVRWSGPELGADMGSVAIESLELAHEKLSRMKGKPTR